MSTNCRTDRMRRQARRQRLGAVVGFAALEAALIAAIYVMSPPFAVSLVAGALSMAVIWPITCWLWEDATRLDAAARRRAADDVTWDRLMARSHAALDEARRLTALDKALAESATPADFQSRIRAIVERDGVEGSGITG